MKRLEKRTQRSKSPLSSNPKPPRVVTFTRTVALMFVTLVAVVLIADGCRSATDTSNKTAPKVSENTQPTQTQTVPVSPPAVPVVNEPQTKPPVSAPAAPAKVVTVPSTPIPQLPPAATPVTLPPKGGVRPTPVKTETDGTPPQIVFGTIAGNVNRKARKPEGLKKAFEAGTGSVWAFLSVRNRDNPTHVTVVWKHKGRVRSKINLRVGVSKGWRTWARRRLMKRDAGPWQVDVLAANGAVLKTMRFKVQRPTVRMTSKKRPQKG
jgi:hypothetical protein